MIIIVFVIIVLFFWSLLSPGTFYKKPKPNEPEHGEFRIIKNCKKCYKVLSYDEAVTCCSGCGNQTTNDYDNGTTTKQRYSRKVKGWMEQSEFNW